MQRMASAHGKERRSLPVDLLVGLPEVLAALRVPDDHVVTSHIFEHGSEISPVYAPCFSQWQFCAASLIALPERTFATAARAVKVGATTTSGHGTG